MPSSANRNKMDICIDFTRPEGREIVLKMTDRADFTGWWGLLILAGTPAPIGDRLNRELKEIL